MDDDPPADLMASTHQGDELSRLHEAAILAASIEEFQGSVADAQP